MTTFVGQQLPRQGTAAQWAAANPILGEGERGYETDTGREKTGDGTTAYNSLPYDIGKGRDLAASEVTVQPVGTIEADNVQDALVELANEAGGGAVDSVNGQTGAVELGAGDVGADPAGSSADVQANLDAHQGLQGLGTHVPAGGTNGQVLGKLAGTNVGWVDPAGGGGAVDSVNGQTGAVNLDAGDVGADPVGSASAAVTALADTLADVATSGAYLDLTGRPTIPTTAGEVGADPAGTAAGAVAAHADDIGLGAHLPTGGADGEVLTHTGAGVAWEAAAVAGTSILVIDYDEVTSEYVPSADPASVETRWWRGPGLPKNIAGGGGWQPGDFYTPTGI